MNKIITCPDECGFCDREDNFRDIHCKHPKADYIKCDNPNIFPKNCPLENGITEEQCRLRTKMARELAKDPSDMGIEPKEPEDINKMVFGPGKDNYGRDTPEWDKEPDREIDIIEVLKKRKADFKLQKYESNEIDTATFVSPIDIITRLVPPDYYAAQFKSEPLPEINKQELINQYKKKYKGNIIHHNPLTESELNMLTFCIDYFGSELRKKEVCPLDDTLVMNMSQVKSLLRTYLPNMQADHILDKMFFKSANKNIKE